MMLQVCMYTTIVFIQGQPMKSCAQRAIQYGELVAENYVPGMEVCDSIDLSM